MFVFLVDASTSSRLNPSEQSTWKQKHRPLLLSQRRNFQIVYDAIGTLADAVGGELNQAKYLEILMPPLIAKWQQHSNFDTNLGGSTEWFGSVIMVVLVTAVILVDL